MESRQTTSSFKIEGRIDTRVHDESKLRDVADDYDSLSREEKLDLTRRVEPDYENTVYNVTTDRLHEYFVDNLDRGQSAAKDNITAEFLALGTDANATPASSNTDLSQREYSQSITDVGDNGKELFTSTFLGSDDGNGSTYEELGLFTGDPANADTNADIFMMNHASIGGVQKEDTSTITFDVTLTFSDV